MTPRRFAIAAIALVLSIFLACSKSSTPEPTGTGPLCDAHGLPRYVENPHVLVRGIGVDNAVCTGEVPCKHNENTDLYRFKGAIYLVHRTAESQILGPNSALYVYRSKDEGASFERIAVIPATDDRDIRDPSFYSVGHRLFLKAITRDRGFTERDEDVATLSVAFSSDDAGETWSETGPMGPEGWGFWRVVESNGGLYSAAYQDGDLQVVLYGSTDGATWSELGPIYQNAYDTPLETELVPTPRGRMLAIVRIDGIDDELLGDKGRLRTKLCWADPPFTSFDCPSEIDGQRLDGAAHFWANGRLFVVARKHLQPSLRKRTSFFELTGNLEGGPLEAKEWGELPSAGDTAYAGTVQLQDGRFLVSWYSGDLASDPPWTASMLAGTDIWLATFDPKKLPPSPPTEAECPHPLSAAPGIGLGDCTPIAGHGGSACGVPCDRGNALGVGEYCTTEEGQCADNAMATTCSDGLNGLLIVKSYLCTLVCDASTDCGPGASCRCPLLETGGQVCGCIPDACVMPLGTEGVLP